ncbi:hypothetical protein ACYBYO_26195, partial [Klebsiella pneumoniae]
MLHYNTIDNAEALPENHLMRCCISQSSITSRTKNNCYSNEDLVMSIEYEARLIVGCSHGEVGVDQDKLDDL